MRPDGFDERLERQGLGRLQRGRVTTLQLNIGKKCSLACHHCHVESGWIVGLLLSPEPMALC